MPKSAIKIIALTLGMLGDYFTFIVNTIKNTIVKNNISIMYFFIATTSFRSVGITAGVNTVRQERVELTLVSHSNFPRNGSKSLENTTVFPA